MDIFKKQLGERITDIRKANNLTQKKLSKLSGLHPTYISSLEKGERNITFENIIKISDALKISLEELFSKPNKANYSKSYKPKKIKFYRLGGTWDMKITDKGLIGDGVMDDKALKKLEVKLNFDERALMEQFDFKLKEASLKKKNIINHLSWIDNIKNLAYGDFMPLFSGDSSHYRSSLFAPLLSYLLDELKKEPDVPILAGVGTDTTDIFVSMMDVFLFDKNVAPFLVSGANRSINEKNSDAPLNFYELVLSAQLDLKSGAYYIFNHTIYAGGDFLKIDPSEHPKQLEGMMTFYSPHKTQLNFNHIDSSSYNIEINAKQKNSINSWSAEEIFLAMAKIVTIDLGNQNPISDEVDRILDEKYKGIVIEAHALGNASFPIRRAIIEAVRMRKLVIVVSRCLIGKVSERYFMALINANSNELVKSKLKIISGRKFNGLTARAILIRAILEGKDSIKTQELVDQLSFYRNLI